MSIALGLVLLAVSPTQESADEAFAEGQRLYAEGRFDEAADALQRAYETDPRPPFLYNWAQAERMAGDCRSAVQLYERFLQTDPPGDDAELAEANLRTCAAELAQDREISSPSRSPAAVVPAAPPADRGALVRRPWHRDPLGGALLGVGTAALATGVGLSVGAVSVRRRADDARQHSDYEHDIGRARALSGAGIAVLATSGALLVGAIVRYVIVARRRR